MEFDHITVEERAARQKEIKERLAEIDSEYSGSALPPDVKAEWDRLNAEYDEHEVAIRDDQARKERLRKLADAPGHIERGVEQPAAPNVIRQVRDVYDLAEIRKQARSIDDLPRLYRENALRAIERSSFPGVRHKEDAQTQAEHLLNTVDDEQGTLARRILVTGSPVYQRAFGKAVTMLSTHGLSTEEQRALALGTDSAGGFAVPFQLDPTVILTSDGSVNPLRQIARVVQIVGKEWQGVTSAGITVTRAAEAAEAADNAPTLEQPTVRPSRVQGFVPFSVEIEQDWNALRTEITTMLADAKEQEEADSFINGNGTPPNPSGLVATLDASSNVNQATITTQAIYAVEEALPSRFRSRARWLANRSVYNAIRQLANGSDGADLWVRLGAGLPPELLGYPAHEMSTMPGSATPQVGDKWLLLGDFQQFLIVDRIGMSVELVPHLFGTNRQPTGQRGLYAIWRNSSVVLVDNAFRVAFRSA